MKPLKRIHSLAKGVLLSALTVVPAAQAANSLHLEGTTLNGMPFSGRVARVSSTTLFLDTQAGGHATEIGIPLSGLESISLGGSGPIAPDAANQMETLLPLIPYWHSATIDRILEWVRSLGESGRWQETWSWAELLEDGVREPGQQVEALLLKATALLEMGLFAELRETLRLLNQRFDPMNAPTALCWLNARSFEHLGQIAAARFWAALPALRIPVSRDAAARNCATLAARLSQTHPEIAPSLPISP